jgi:hypothetical protein
MLPLASSTVFVDLVVLFVLTLPLGSLLVRGVERFVGRPLNLTLPERILLAFYASGGLLFLIASIPLPLYGFPLVVGLLVVGVIGFTILSFLERGVGLRAVIVKCCSWPMLALGVGTLGLLGLEVTSGLVPLPNGVDGSVTSLYVNLILRNHTLPFTLAPFSSDGVVYPQGAPVWMTVPVLLFNWPIVSAPVNLPPLFLGLTGGAAFCLGERLTPSPRSSVPWMGLLLAASFGLLFSWPRLYVAGSYDFIFAFPLFLVILGFLSPFVGRSFQSWREVIAFGALIGITTALSAAVGTVLVLLVVVYTLVFRTSNRKALPANISRLAAAVGVALLFVTRSIIALVIWFNLPGHVQVDAGSPPYYLPGNAQIYAGVISMLDPFVPWKWRVSPIPILSLEIQLLLAAGLVIAVLCSIRNGRVIRTYVSPVLAKWILVGTVSVFLETSVLLVLQALNTSLSGIQSVTNLWETSILLFTFFELLAVLPLVASMNYLLERPHPRRYGATFPEARRRRRKLFREEGDAREHRGAQALAIVVLVLPLATGLGATVVEVPTYLHSYIVAQANGTQADLSALEWAGAHLPSCSRVLVAPGSAAQFLPEYAVLALVFPVYPTPINLSYHTVVSDLTAGVYSNSTRQALLSLSITEVFGTGQTTNAYPAFRLGELQNSFDFRVLFQDQDAEILSFLPGLGTTGCAPT